MRHVQIALRDEGLAEIPGPASHPRIDEAFDRIGQPNWRDNISWCAAILCLWLEEAGMRSPRAATARSFTIFGTQIALSDIRRGDIIVTPRGTEPWQGHVEIALEAPRNGQVKTIGGNESDAVRIGYTKLSDILPNGARRPPAPEQAPRHVQRRVQTDAERFAQIWPLLHYSEGGYVNDPADRGGPTKYGITLFTARRLGLDKDGDGDVDALDVRNLTVEDAQKVYLSDYWRPSYAHVCPHGLDYMAFDMGVNHGPRNAVRILQEGLGVASDGIFGPKTRAAVDALDGPGVKRVLRATAAAREAFYLDIIRRDPSQARFQDGWLNRNKRVLRDALAMVDEPARVTERVAETVRHNPGKTAGGAIGVIAILAGAVISLGCEWPLLANFLNLSCGG